MKNILITGGGGYIGTNLTKELLNEGCNVTVIDTFWFGNYLEKHKKLKIIKKDIRNISKKDLNKIDCIMHLASIANDPAAELDARLTWDVNVLATYKLINLAIIQKVKKFIFASSGSVYGIKKEKKVVENLSLEPISEYNKSKMIGERVLLSYKKNIDITILRPATVCGFSPRMRLDVSVNMFAFQAIKFGSMSVFGGEQIRPNIDESSQILGATSFRMIRSIHFPLIRGSMITASLLVFVDVLKELPATLILRPFDFNTLAVKTYELAGDERLADASLPALTIVMAGIIPVILLTKNLSKTGQKW